MRKIRCLLFVLKRSYICYYIICMIVPLILIIPLNSTQVSMFFRLPKADSNFTVLAGTNTKHSENVTNFFNTPQKSFKKL